MAAIDYHFACRISLINESSGDQSNTYLRVEGQPDLNYLLTPPTAAGSIGIDLIGNGRETFVTRIDYAHGTFAPQAVGAVYDLTTGVRISDEVNLAGSVFASDPRVVAKGSGFVCWNYSATDPTAFEIFEFDRYGTLLSQRTFETGFRRVIQWSVALGPVLAWTGVESPGAAPQVMMQTFGGDLTPDGAAVSLRTLSPDDAEHAGVSVSTEWGSPIAVAWQTKSVVEAYRFDGWPPVPGELVSFPVSNAQPRSVRAEVTYQALLLTWVEEPGHVKYAATVNQQVFSGTVNTSEWTGGRLESFAIAGPHIHLILVAWNSTDGHFGRWLLDFVPVKETSVGGIKSMFRNRQ